MLILEALVSVSVSKVYRQSQKCCYRAGLAHCLPYTFNLIRLRPIEKTNRGSSSKKQIVCSGDSLLEFDCIDNNYYTYIKYIQRDRQRRKLCDPLDFYYFVRWRMQSLQSCRPIHYSPRSTYKLPFRFNPVEYWSKANCSIPKP